MADRLELQTLLEGLLGSRNVYHQPPETYKMSYPAIRYKVDGVDTTFADNKPYSSRISYMVTLITEDPEHPAWWSLLNLSMSVFSRHYMADGLNHYVYILFF